MGANGEVIRLRIIRIKMFGDLACRFQNVPALRYQRTITAVAGIADALAGGMAWLTPDWRMNRAQALRAVCRSIEQTDAPRGEPKKQAVGIGRFTRVTHSGHSHVMRRQTNQARNFPHRMSCRDASASA
jgi:hypothetical protein